MNKKIFGVTVGTPLPKPNLMQTDPTKGDFVKGKDAIPTKVSQLENDSGYLEENKLTSAISTALAQAKESGEFKGEDGKPGEDGYTPIKGVDYFTEADKAEIVVAVKNESKQKYGKLIVFGDSLGEGSSNNDYSFVDILGESGEFSSVVKACRNSATIGPYSADYAVGYDLISQIERYASDVADADIILCEYQFNDIYAIISGAVTMGYKGDAETDTTVCGYMKKALNRIRELNPTAHITWVMSGKYDFDRALFGNDMVDLLLLFEATALTLARTYSVGIISIMEEAFGEGLVSSDGLHPNTAGHERIARIILNNLYGNSDIILPERTLRLTGDLSRPETMSIDGSIINIMQMLVAGIRVRMVYDGGDGAIMFDATLAGPDGLVLNATAGNLGSYTILWSMDGSIEFLYDSNTGGGGGSGGTVSWSDLTDKPFYTGDPVETEVFNLSTAWFDGDYPVWEQVEQIDDTTYLWFSFPYAPRKVFEVGKEYTVVIDGVEHKTTAVDSAPIFGEPGPQVGLGDVEALLSDTIPASFQYAICESDDYGNTYFNILYRGETPPTEFKVLGIEPEIGKIDPKYLPDCGVGYVTKGEYGVLAERTVEITGVGDDVYGDEHQLLSRNLVLALGETYRVTINGVVYERVAYPDPDDSSVVWVGGDSDPFKVKTQRGWCYFYPEENGTYTVKLEGTPAPVYHRIDPRFLPDDIVFNNDLYKDRELMQTMIVYEVREETQAMIDNAMVEFENDLYRFQEEVQAMIDNALGVIENGTY